MIKTVSPILKSAMMVAMVMAPSVFAQTVRTSSDVTTMTTPYGPPPGVNLPNDGKRGVIVWIKTPLTNVDKFTVTLRAKLTDGRVVMATEGVLFLPFPESTPEYGKWTLVPMYVGEVAQVLDYSVTVEPKPLAIAYFGGDGN